MLQANSDVRLNHKTGKLEPSYAEFKKPPHPLVSSGLRLLSSFHLIRLYTVSDPPPQSIPITTSDDTIVPETRHPDEIVACSNLTIINLVLVLCGPMREDTLCGLLLLLQGFCGVLGFVIRHRLAFLVYDREV
jgi:UDP-N-acetylglucosamine--dolichyl-phosphate N-acetylglucosaminephosphotransferase